MRELELTVLAVNAAEAGWTLADVTDEGVAPVGLADVAYPSVMTRVWMARTCVEEEEKWSLFKTRSFIIVFNVAQCLSGRMEV